MRYMIIIKATPSSEAGIMPGEELLQKMQGYHAELAKAGALVDGAGLKPSSNGWRIRYSGDKHAGDKRTYIDGPFAETKELIAGYTVIKVKSLQEAIEWTKRFPNPAGRGHDAEIEVREFFELEDFEPGPTIEKFRAIGLGSKA
jgi:hypothetical protein